ncbi:hypothetical protein lbkm_3026 [Lachnospiraceae bacterium KM106-2]|nr:hypothetical protein lbkm_3026 [Lachnospiraceae bacterium KM106-2]
MRRNVLPGQIYRHFKNNLYQIITVATHTESEEQLVVYQALYGTFKTYARPIQMFLSEVDHEKYPDVKQKYRFELITLEEQKNLAPAELATESIVVKADVPIEAELTEKSISNRKEGEVAVNPDLLSFLDADTYEAKLEVVTDAVKRLDETTLHSMAVSMDITLAEGSREDKIQSLMQCLQTLNKYERGRHR